MQRTKEKGKETERTSITKQVHCEQEEGTGNIMSPYIFEWRVKLSMRC